MTVVTHAMLADVNELADLFVEMDKFYGEAIEESVEAKARNIIHALFGDLPFAHALVAREGDVIVGFASYSFLWPAAMSTKSLYLKELYVRQGHRKSGIGRILMTQILKVAAETNCSRVEWTTDWDNQGARTFYEQLGFPQNSAKLFYRIEQGDLQNI